MIRVSYFTDREPSPKYTELQPTRPWSSGRASLLHCPLLLAAIDTQSRPRINMAVQVAQSFDWRLISETHKRLIQRKINGHHWYKIKAFSYLMWLVKFCCHSSCLHACQNQFGAVDRERISTFRIWGSNSGDYKINLLRYNAMYSFESQRRFEGTCHLRVQQREKTELPTFWRWFIVFLILEFWIRRQHVPLKRAFESHDIKLSHFDIIFASYLVD